MKSENPMLDILKKRLPEGLEIIKVKDKASASQMQIWFSYKGVEKAGWLYKTCAPGCENKICDQTIASAMLGVALKLKDLSMADYWTDKLFNP